MAAGQAVAGSHMTDLHTPAKLFQEGFQSMAIGSTSEETAAKGSVAAAVLLLSRISSSNPNTSLAYGGFLLILLQNVLLPESQVIFSKAILNIFIFKNIFIRIIIQIRIEKKRRDLGLSRLKLTFNIFKKQKRKDFVFKYLRIKKPTMVKAITL